MGEEVPTAETICGTRPVEVKIKMQKAAHLAGEKRNQRMKAAENRVKAMIDRESAWCLLTVVVTISQTGVADSSMGKKGKKGTMNGVVAQIAQERTSPRLPLTPFSGGNLVQGS